MVDIDEIDEKLLSLLHNNPRESAEVLANKVNLSPSTVRRRIDKLIRTGAFRTIVSSGPARTGLPLISVICLNVRPDKIEEAMIILRNRFQVRWVSTTTGRYDIILLARFASNTDLSRFMQTDIGRIEGLRAHETFLCLDIMTSESALGY